MNHGRYIYDISAKLINLHLTEIETTTHPIYVTRQQVALINIPKEHNIPSRCCMCKCYNYLYRFTCEDDYYLGTSIKLITKVLTHETNLNTGVKSSYMINIPLVLAEPTYRLENINTQKNQIYYPNLCMEYMISRNNPKQTDDKMLKDRSQKI